ncbi:ABC transporter substrate-binding protein [Kineosporia succinea]|uniref:Multiple sugar transport system substrate-binding protein n=1 Tax=Kineosporia succinea TaxID=84632 RepID=A0ABT9P2B0_9ACTN|nr:ABC transporter substrate-binding protein [Kineosporia succinea]MDP9826235.1 multiple sugar transport system substrate-binding protein [Kineosporia succinea]
MRGKGAAAVASILGTVLALSACGGGSSEGSGGGTNEGRGPFTFVTGKDLSGIMPYIAEEWNKAHPDEKVTIRQQSDAADQQLSDLQQHFQAKDPDYDVVTVDVVWTAEFAAKGWIVPLKGDLALDQGELLPATVTAATYNGTQFAAPYDSDGGLLYYRTDLVKEAPTTWEELISDCDGKTTSGTITGSKPGCYAGQLASYEGLTVNASEAINAAGGTIVSDDGKSATVDSAQATAGLDFLVNGFKEGYIPKEALGFKETESLNAFAAGDLMFLRNWPYAYAQLNGDSKVKGKFGVAPLPGPNGSGASSLGGHSAAISTYSKNQASALDFLKFLQSEDIQKNQLVKGSKAPVIASLYDDADLNKEFAYLATLKKSIETAVPRPVTPFYPAVTQAIQTNAYAALQGKSSTADALKDMAASINSAAAGG